MYDSLQSASTTLLSIDLLLNMFARYLESWSNLAAMLYWLVLVDLEDNR